MRGAMSNTNFTIINESAHHKRARLDNYNAIKKARQAKRDRRYRRIVVKQAKRAGLHA